MDMTRAFAKQIIKQGYAQHPQKLWSIQHKQACEMALADMEKVEQIEQIIKEFDGKDGGDYFKTIEKISGVLDGKDIGY